MAVAIVISNTFKSVDTSAVFGEERAHFKIMGRWMVGHRHDRLLCEDVHTVAASDNHQHEFSAGLLHFALVIHLVFL